MTQDAQITATVENAPAHKAELLSNPPTTFVGLENDGTFKEWMRQLGGNTSTYRARKAIARALTALVKACATEQHSASEKALCEAVAQGAWVDTNRLPAPYEEVRILVDGVARIARLAHDKTHFQLATFLANTKSQYLVPVEKVTGWQPLVAAAAADAVVLQVPA
jgi:hypothetical protein